MKIIIIIATVLALTSGFKNLNQIKLGQHEDGTHEDHPEQHHDEDEKDCHDTCNVEVNGMDENCEDGCKGCFEFPMERCEKWCYGDVCNECLACHGMGE